MERLKHTSAQSPYAVGIDRRFLTTCVFSVHTFDSNQIIVFISGAVPAVVYLYGFQLMLYIYPGQFYLLLFMHPVRSFWCNFGIWIKFLYFFHHIRTSCYCYSSRNLCKLIDCFCMRSSCVPCLSWFMYSFIFDLRLLISPFCIFTLFVLLLFAVIYVPTHLRFTSSDFFFLYFHTFRPSVVCISRSFPGIVVFDSRSVRSLFVFGPFTFVVVTFITCNYSPSTNYSEKHEHIVFMMPQTHSISDATNK